MFDKACRLAERSKASLTSFRRGFESSQGIYTLLTDLLLTSLKLWYYDPNITHLLVESRPL